MATYEDRTRGRESKIRSRGIKIVARKTWKRIFQLGIIISIVGGGIYITLFFLSTPSQVISDPTYHTVDSVIVVDTVLVSGDNESTRYNDTDYLKLRVKYAMGTVIHFDCYFLNVNETPNRVFWLRFNLRANITITGTDAMIYYGIYPEYTTINTSFVMRDHLIGVFNTTINTLEVEFYIQTDNKPFYIECDLVELYYVEYISPNYLTTIGIVIGVILSVGIVYWYLNRRGFFTETDSRRLLSKIEREERRIKVRG